MGIVHGNWLTGKHSGRACKHENYFRIRQSVTNSEVARSSELSERYKQCSSVLVFISKQRGAQRRSVTNVTNVTHFRVRIPRYKQRTE